MGSSNKNQLETKNPAVGVKHPHQSTPSSTQKARTNKINKNPKSSSGGVRHRKHPFKKHVLVEENN
jgi:hypothetical protein